MTESVDIMGDLEGRPFQVETSTITDDSFLVLSFLSSNGEEFGEVRITPNRVNFLWKCYGDDFKLTHGGTDSGGIWTFLKTLSNMTVWFNDDLVTEYEFTDNSDIGEEACSLKDTVAHGIRFSTSLCGNCGQAAVAYRAHSIYRGEVCMSTRS